MPARFDIATDQIEQAKPLMDGDRDDRKNAEMLLVRAELDAELALEMAKTAEQRAEARTAPARVQGLRKGGE